ncbi:MAG: hypothetical protein B0D91_04120 [Oceanospirillales bacterium LUC14_002_19_P2]|nr:MAG: hypothetical protein B0D91_04120 [Oceanospirillales bacterium LUC14_002_19_P2]
MKTTNIAALGLMTFSLFLVAGNLIFPPHYRLPGRRPDLAGRRRVYPWRCGTDPAGVDRCCLEWWP